MQSFHTHGHVFGGSLLVAGTTIGVGMLAMPLATADGGFLPSIALYLICWIFMISTGLLLLEVCLWMPKESNMITMVNTLLGFPGKIICWIAYLLLFFLVTVAHIAGGAEIFMEMMNNLIPHWGSAALFVALLAPFVYLGTLSVDRTNLILMAGLVLFYLIFILSSMGFVDLKLLERQNWSKAWLALPVLFIAFAYQAIIPTLVTYMKRDVKNIRRAIFIGTGIPFVFYLFWEFVLLGIIPFEGPNGLKEAALKGQIAIIPLKELTSYSYLLSVTGHRYLFLVGKVFSFFAITTSFITVSLAYLDFLADGFKWEKTKQKKRILCALIFIPPMILSMTFPNIFLAAANYAGGFCCALLFGLLPPLMVWAGRHIHHYPDATKQLFGGKYFLSLLIFFCVFEIGIEILSLVIKRYTL